MEGVLKSDIFFVIASLAVIVISVLAVAALFYVVMILRDIKEVSRKIKEESALIGEDFRELRAALRREGIKVKLFWDFLKKLTKKGRKKQQ